MKVKITKLKELENAVYANNIEEGFTRTKEVDSLPIVKVGKCVYLSDENSYFRSSKVTEVINETTFKTKNSIYRVEVI